MTSRTLSEHLLDNPTKTLAVHAAQATDEAIDASRLGSILAVIAAVVGVFVPVAGSVGWLVSMAHASTSALRHAKPARQRARETAYDLVVVAVGLAQIPWVSRGVFVYLALRMAANLLVLAFVTSGVALGEAAGLDATARLAAYVRAGDALAAAFEQVEVDPAATATEEERREAAQRLSKYLADTGAVRAGLHSAFTLDVLGAARALAELASGDDSLDKPLVNACYIALVERFITERSNQLTW